MKSPKKTLRTLAVFVASRDWDSVAYTAAEMLRCSLVSLVMNCGQSGNAWARQDVERRYAAFREHAHIGKGN